MKKHNINININFTLPEKHEIESVVLKIADFTESLYTTVPAKAKSKAKSIKDNMPATKEKVVNAIKEKAPEGAKKAAANAKNGAVNFGVKAKAFKEATVEAGKMLGSAFSETMALFADTASESAAIFSDTIKTISGKNSCECNDDCACCEYDCQCEDDCAQCDRGEDDACCCKKDDEDGEDEEDDLTSGQLATGVPSKQSECPFSKAVTDLLMNFKIGCHSLKNAIKDIKQDVKIIREKDPAASSDVEVLFLYSGLHAVMAHRIAHFLHKKDFTVTARAVSQITKAFTGIEIHPGATIGKGLFIDHGTGVVIGETTIIGDNCTIYQGVTLGGTGKQTGKRHPTLLNDVMVGAGAKVLGPVIIGNNTKIAAGAVVLSDIPDHSTAVGIPARVVKCNNIRVDELDQIHIPDPISQELCKLNIRLEAAEKELKMINRGNNEAL